MFIKNRPPLRWLIFYSSGLIFLTAIQSGVSKIYAPLYGGDTVQIYPAISSGCMDFKSKIAFKYTSTSTITPDRTFSSASQGYIFDIHPISYITEEEIKSYRAIKFMTSAKYTVVITQTAANSSNFCNCSN